MPRGDGRCRPGAETWGRAGVALERAAHLLAAEIGARYVEMAKVRVAREALSK